jgi:hypothetical protein
LLNQHRRIETRLNRNLFLVYFQILLAVAGGNGGLRDGLGLGDFEVVRLAEALIIDLKGYLHQSAKSLLLYLGIIGFLADQWQVTLDMLGTKV